MTDISLDDGVSRVQGSNSPPAEEQGGETSPLTMRKAARDLSSAAPLIQGGFLAVGAVSGLAVLSVLGPAFALVSLALLLPFGLIGWLIAQLARAGANAFEAWAERVETAGSAERRVVSAIGRVAEALERSATTPPTGVMVQSDPLAEIGKAMQEAKWEHAGTLIREFGEAHPDAPDGPRLARELESARAAEARGLRARIDAAREVGDPDRVLELHDALRPLLVEQDLRTLDQELTRWLMALIQKRLRAGTIRVDVVELAAKVAERFDHTSEGASLRAALPTLRRSAGLCARCGKPYTGIADACPACLTTQSFPAFGTDSDPESAENDDPDQVFLPDEPV
jgi:hypothetical protein